MWNVQFAGGHGGDYLGSAEGSSLDAAVSLNGGEGGTVSIPVDAFDGTSADLSYLTVPKRRWVVVCWHQYPVYAGQIIKRRYSSKTRSLTLVTEDVWSVISGRYMITPGDDPAASNLKWGPASLSTLAVRVVQHAINRPESLAGLPIDFPDLVAGTSEVEYAGYNATTVGLALEKIMGWEGGPDIYFRPYWSGKFLRFEMQAAPNLNAGRFLDVNLDAGDMADEVTEEEDASQLVTRAYVFGEGNGEDTKSITEESGTQVYMTSEAVYPDKRTNALAPLRSYGRRMVSRYGEPTHATTLTLQASGAIPPYDLIPGMSVKIRAATDPWLPYEDTFRIAGYDFKPGTDGGPGVVNVDLQR